MSTDELLDAHTLRLRNDPGYAAIWQRATAPRTMQLITAMLAWAEQADGLRAMACANVDDSRPMAVECPYCGGRFGFVLKNPAEGAKS